MALDFLALADKKLGDQFNSKPAKDQTPARREKVIKSIDGALAQLKANEDNPQRGLYTTKEGITRATVRLGSRPLTIKGESEFYVPRERAADFYNGVKKATQAGELDDAIRALFTDEGGKPASKTKSGRSGNYGWSPERKAKFQATLAAKKGAPRKGDEKVTQ